MRIAFINTVDTSGGAAIVTQRLMKQLHETYASENHFLVKAKTGDANNTRQILTNQIEINAEKIIERISRPLGLLYQFFPFSSRSILKAVRLFKPDIINLHNTHGGYFATPLLQELSRIAPIVWTLHDMWSFTANASHTFGNMSWKYLKNDAVLKKIPPSIGINTGAWLLRQKKKIYNGSNLTIVTPSRWLQELALQSPLFEGKMIHQIYNGIDTEVFRKKDRQLSKAKLRLFENCKTVMFSSHFLNKNNPWKGGPDLLDILVRINANTDTKINLLILGERKPDEFDTFPNFNVFYKGYVKDEEVMADCLNAADLFIYPTRADNLPNVLIESIACGTPCITFNIGGNNEIIRHGYNGVIIQPFNFDAFSLNTLSLLKNEEQLASFSANCLSITNQFFLIHTMVQKYYNLFQDIINQTVK
jgi:glycosyltransferase involved in cell wall biosynthesis